MNKMKFFHELKSFKDFNLVADDKHYTELPSNWIIIITDVKDATKAIDSGRYKDVNTIGAASIISVQKGMEGIEFPFIFGGDGASLAIPHESLRSVEKKLLALKRLSEEQFQLNLRVGMIRVSELKSHGFSTTVAKFELTGGKSIAFFSGGGLAKAEELIKAQEDKYAMTSSIDEDADLSGLSCRWRPIPNKNGNILSLLVESRSIDKTKVYSQFLEKLLDIFDGDLEQANPVNVDVASYKSIIECYQAEKNYHHSVFSFKFLCRLLDIVSAVLIFKWGFRLLNFDPKKYAQSMRTHSDFRKFDDMLRLVLDCHQDQFDAIEKYLHSEYQAGNLFYGTFTSKNCLMTCYVDSLADGQHLHFIDGGDGGYAMASKQLKAQIQLAALEEKSYLVKKSC